jgi:glycolate oxidase
MDILNKSFRSVEELSRHIKNGQPTFYSASKTSTVIPYDKIESSLGDSFSEFCLGDLSSLESKIELDANENLLIKGPITWKEARAYCRSLGRDVMTAPTEELASILSGLATSATGERCFGLGTLRDQVIWLKYIDNEGNEKVLSADKSLSDHDFFQTDKEKDLLESYQASYEDYKEFKNAPFPRMQVETDLMTGTEGQLGVVIEACIKTITFINGTYIFFKLPKWEEDYNPHLELFNKVQEFRSEIYACELLDSNSLSYLKAEDKPPHEGDLVFLEVEADSFEKVYEELLSQLKLTSEEDIFEMPMNQCHELRMAIPRETFEANTRMGVTKKGTDVQISIKDFAHLLEFYKKWTTKDVGYNLFGHFGDAHLHFNFMPTKEQEPFCQKELLDLYDEVVKLKGSPFSEHGIGIIKQKFIKSFWQDIQFEMFAHLKNKMDKTNNFFPQGYMGIKDHQ